jgi:hypothetical protein
MRNLIIIAIAAVVVAANVLIAHYYGVPCLPLTPLVLILVSGLLAFGLKDINVLVTSILTFALIALHDCLIIRHIGGRHDEEGIAWVRLSLFAGLLPAFGILWAAFVRRSNESLKAKIGALVLFVGLMAAYLFISGK